VLSPGHKGAVALFRRSFTETALSKRDEFGVVSDFMPLEKVVLFAARALRAFEAANQQNPYGQGDEHRQQSRIRRKPMNQNMHKCRKPTLRRAPSRLKCPLATTTELPASRQEDNYSYFDAP
jgi:hypothetical protein